MAAKGREEVVRVRALVGLMVLVLVGAGCSSSAKKSTSVRAGSSGLGLTGLDASGPSGVVATGTAKQKVRADLAFVVIASGDSPFGQLSSGAVSITDGSLPPGFPFPPSSTVPPAKDHDAVRAALRPLGITNDAIDFARSDSSDGTLGDGELQVEVPVAKLPKIATAVVAAVKKARGSVGTSGLRFAVADCGAAISTARDKAVADARKHAQELATAAGVTLGDLTAVTEQAAQSGVFSYLTGGQAPCGRSSVSGASGLGSPDSSAVAALDAKPEVELAETVSASYALDHGDERSIAAVGTGEVTGKADSADIVIQPQSDGFDPTTPPKKLDHARVLRALAALGIAKDAVEIEDPVSLSSFSNPLESSYVRVSVKVAQLPTIGAKIVTAVQSVVGTDATSGVTFKASNCSDLIARARAAAAADAGKRLDKLALASHVKAGAIVGVADASAANPYFPNVDPCDPDSSVVPTGLASAVAQLGVAPLVGLDAPPKVTEHVSLVVSRALTS